MSTLQDFSRLYLARRAAFLPEMDDILERLVEQVYFK
jgi:hypothetical protein